MKKPFENDVVLKTELFQVGQDWEIPIPAFFIIAPLRKIRSISEFTDKEATEFIMLARKIRIAMSEALKIDDVYFFQNEDSVHGFHLWMFPRHSWMLKFGGRIESVRPIINFARDTMFNQSTFDEIKTDVAKVKEHLALPS